ncbi:MAG: acyl-CoA dehydrogenase family protein, partial [Actinomycetota bacterium]|nr:acyl-CoA dehydrogenase family protein [Actinomycetota bacterium]
MIDAVFADYRRTRPQPHQGGLDRDLWHRLDELGLVRLTGAEEAGGSGAGWYEAAELLTAAARHGVRMPLAENDLLACWLLDTAGVSSASAVRTVCDVDAGGSASGVPWASCADRVVVVWADDDGHRAADIAAEQLTITAGTNMIGEP